jgi:nicotinamide-nucleotide amidase
LGNGDGEAASVSALAVFRLLKARGMKLSTAESCTGGMIAAALTDIAGSSEVFDRGFVTYSNSAKTQMLRVPAAMITTLGAVSVDVARAMADGALRQSQADVSIAVTGIAGPDGGTAAKPVGLVHFACALRHGKIAVDVRTFAAADRHSVRVQARDHAFQMIRDVIKASG